MPRIEVKGVMELDGSGWERTIRQAEATTERFSSDMGELKNLIAGVFSIAAIQSFVRSTVDSTEQIRSQSEQFGVTTDQVQKLDWAAKQVGLSFDDVGRAISKFGAIRKEAGEKEGEALAQLQKYGLTLDDIRNAQLSNLDLMLKMSEAMHSVSLTPEGRQDLREFFGKGGDKLSSVLSQLQSFKPIALIQEGQIQVLHNALMNAEEFYRKFRAGTVEGFTRIESQFMGKLIDTGILKPFAGKTKDETKAWVRDYFRNGTWASPEHPEARATGQMFGPPSPGTNGEIFKFKDNKDLWDQLHKAERENQESGLNREEKILELKKEQAEIEKRMQDERGDALLKDQIQYVQNDTKLKEILAQHGHMPAVNSQMRTGNFLGANGASVSNIFERMVKAQHDAVGYLKVIAQQLGGASGQVNTNGSTGIPPI